MDQDKLIKDAQYRKGLSIAFFNATNAAVEMVKLEGKQSVKKGRTKKEVSFDKRIVFWRDWLIKEHQDYYGKVIANVGVNYVDEDAIEKLEKANTSLSKLQAAWKLLSEDERHDEKILKVAQKLRKAYEKA